MFFNINNNLYFINDELSLFTSQDCFLKHELTLVLNAAVLLCVISHVIGVYILCMHAKKEGYINIKLTREELWPVKYYYQRPNEPS